MRREKGKVSTEINKDNVAAGAVKAPIQIKTEGSKTPKTWMVKHPSKEQAKTGKSLSPVDPELRKKVYAEINRQLREPKPKEYTKKIENERTKG